MGGNSLLPPPQPLDLQISCKGTLQSLNEKDRMQGEGPRDMERLESKG